VWGWGSNGELACFFHIRSARVHLGHSAHVPSVSWLPCASPYPDPYSSLSAVWYCYTVCE